MIHFLTAKCMKVIKPNETIIEKQYSVTEVPKSFTVP